MHDILLSSFYFASFFNHINQERCKKDTYKNNSWKSKVSWKIKSSRTRLQFPVERLHRYLKEKRYGDKVIRDASVFIVAVLEYLTDEISELAGNDAHDNKKTKFFFNMSC